MSVPSQVGLELIEESPAAFVDSSRRQAVSNRVLTGERLEMAVLRELPERPPDRPFVVDEPKNVGDGDAYVLNLPDRLYAGQGRTEPVDEIRHEEFDSEFKL